MKLRALFVTLGLFALVAGGMIAAPALHAATPAGKSKPGAGEDLRAVYANVTDVAEGGRATAACVRCHGANGISTAKGVPHVAGQRPAYLYAKLRAYQAGTRGDHGMEGAIKFLSDDALVKIAAYYASLDPVQPPAKSTGKPAPAKPDPVAAGKAAAAACGGCHGETGISKIPGMPSLVGLDPKYFVAAMTAYKNGQRKHDMMKSFAAPLSDTAIANLALFYAAQKPAKAQTPAAGNPAAGKTAAAACAGCHGEQGVSANPDNPSIAGQDAEYFVTALRAYKDGSRKDDMMKSAVSALTDGAMKDMAAYYAGLQPQQPKADKPLSTAEWVQKCDRCHGINGNSTDPRTPALAGQRIEYLDKSLHAYQSGARKDSVMAAMSSGLSESDVASLAAHYSQQRPRAFVFMDVQCK
ncbi:MAG: c-type cytochrome [Burkholderiales bacterium]|nr:c-type cytochrome [Burkholderiales bacterium]